MLQVLEYTIDRTRYAVPMPRVVEVVPRVRFTPLPEAPAVIAGVFTYRGTRTVAVDLRACFGYPPRAPSSDDHLLVVRSARRVVALVVDRVLSLRTIGAEGVQMLSPPVAHVSGVVALHDGVLLLQDLDAVLSPDEARAVDRATALLASGG